MKFVGGLPKTRNAKLMRRVVRAAYFGERRWATGLSSGKARCERPLAVEEIQKSAEPVSLCDSERRERLRESDAYATLRLSEAQRKEIWC